MFGVTITEKGGAQRRMDFDKAEVTIGRVQGNDIILPKGNVSKRHSRIVLKDGRFIIVDLKSTNGTYVNGRKITSPIVLRTGDKVYIGDYILSVEEGVTGGGDGVAPPGHWPAPAPPPIPAKPQTPPPARAAPPAAEEVDEPSVAEPLPPPMEPVRAPDPPRPPVRPPSRPPRESRPEPPPRVEPRPEPPRPAPRSGPKSDVRPAMPARADRAGTLAAAVGKLRERLAQKMGAATMTAEELASAATRDRAERIGEELLGAMDDAAELDPTLERSTILAEAIGEAIGAGAIDSLLADAEVSEVLVDGPRTIHVIRRGAREKTDRTFSSEAALVDAIRRLLPGGGAGPVIQGVSPRGDRVVAVLPPASAHGPSVSVRRAPSAHPDLDKLVSSDCLSREMAEFLYACLGARRNVLVAGDVASGKTTLLDALAGSLPPEERVIVIEPELEIERPGWVTLRPSAGGPPADLVLAALAMHPDRLVVSDLSGAETYPVLRAIGGRLRGSLLSVHAYDSKGALSKLTTLASLSTEANPSAVRVLVSEVVDVVALVERHPDGRHRLVKIDVRSEDGSEGYTLREAFALKGGKYEASGAAAKFLQRTTGSD